EVDLHPGVFAAALDAHDDAFAEAGVRHVLAHPPGHAAVEAQGRPLLGLGQAAVVARVAARVAELAPFAASRARRRRRHGAFPARTPAVARRVETARRAADPRREPLQ